ncbi:MAG TPA: DASS family sodium-coupled anion symporter [Telmatospirillum sp.]|nr:DASS family sodium-coupled anion symporter [Telmatospirillum sp.]
MPATTELGGFGALRQKAGFPLAIAMAVAVWGFGTPHGLSPEGHKALVLFVGIFVLYITEAIPLAASSLLVVPIGALMGVSSVKGMLEGFSSPSTYLIVGAFVLAVAMVKTRLAERITYLILSKIGCSATRITFGVTLSNIVLAFLVPSSTARTAILLPVCLSIISLLGTEGRSKFAVNLLLCLAFTNATISAGILTATVPNPVTVEFIVKAGGKAISYTDWLIFGFPPALLMTVITWITLQKMFPAEPIDSGRGRELIAEGLASLGPMSFAEWRTLFIFLAVVLLWVSQTWTGLDTTLVCLLGACALFFPKIGVIDWSDANKGVSWQVVLICGGGVSLGDVLMKTGAAKWIATGIFTSLGLTGASVLVLLLVVMLVLLYLHFVFVGTTAMATALLPIVAGLAQAAGLPPEILILPAGMIIGGYPLVMFYSTLPNIIVYGSGKLTVGDFVRVGSVLCLPASAIYALCAATYWRWLGLF